MLTSFIVLLIWVALIVFGLIRKNYFICLFSTMLVLNFFSGLEKDINTNWGYLLIVQIFLFICYIALEIFSPPKK